MVIQVKRLIRAINMKNIEVVAAIIIHGDEILCVQRAKNKLEYISEKFEFPGGKIEKGESKIEALSRELIEELDVRPEIQSLYLTVIHQYPDFKLTMHSFKCVAISKDLQLSEHISYKWLTKNKLDDLDWAAADIPIAQKLMTDE